MCGNLCSDAVRKEEFLDGSTLVSASGDGSTKYWDVSTGTSKDTDTVAGEHFALSTAPGGKEQRAGRLPVTFK